MFDWFCEKIIIFLIMIVCFLYIGGIVFLVYDGQQNPAPEEIIKLAEGRLICMRYMGSWYNNTELKFDDGSMCVVPYGFACNLREWTQYKIWWSSFHGYKYEEMK